MPDLKDFKLLPYVPHITPKITDELLEPKIISIDNELRAEINKKVEEASKGELSTIKKAENMYKRRF